MKKLTLFLIFLAACAFDGSANAIVIEADTIGTAVVDTLTSIANDLGVDVEIETPLVRDVIINQADEIAMCLEIPGDDPLKRRVPVKISFMTPDDDIVRVATVVAQVRTYAVAAVAVADVSEETPLTDNDIEFQRVNVTGVNGYFSIDTSLEDLQTKRKLKAGTILSDQSVEPIPLIRRGELVTINVSVGSVTIKAEGIARQDGGRNEIIRVYTESTNKTITCRVIDPGMVVASR